MPLSIVSPDTLQYQGRFSGTLGPDSVAIDGEGSVTFTDKGEPRIVVTLAAESASSEALNRAYMSDGVFRGSNHVKWQSASVQTADGVFRVTEQPFLFNRELMPFATAPQTVTLGGLATEFVAVSKNPAKYWMLPVAGLPWTSLPLRFKELDGHPMWLPQNQDIVKAGRIPPCIAFLFDGKPAFIQQATLDLRKSPPDQQTDSRTVTSVVVGEVSNQSFDFHRDRPQSWFPMHLLSWLTLATGTRLAAPWIELHDDEGDLVRRIHRPLGRTATTNGRARIDERLCPRAIGRLLTATTQSEHFGEKQCAIPLLLLNECVTSGGSLEYRKVQLSRAFELLSSHFDIRFKERLIDTLSSDVRDEVERTVAEAASYLGKLVENRTASDRTAVERIRARLAGIGGKENSFGMHVVSVASQFGLHDAKVLDSYFNAAPVNRNSTWAGVLSYFRGAVMHEGFLSLDIAGGTVPLYEAVAVVDHLEDVLVRVLLSMIDYRGSYVSLIRRSLNPVPIDWVKSNMSPDGLGFGVDWSA